MTDQNKKRVVMFSGGVGSWATAKRVAREHGTKNLILLFADTKIEDDDLFRFLKEASADVGGKLVMLCDGRDPWQVFFDVKFLGNNRVAPCSRILKRELLRKWINQHCDPKETVVSLGYDWSEDHRIDAAREHWEPWEVHCPMREKPYLTKDQQIEWLESCGIKRPLLYEQGFSHNNCAGFCVRGGQAHFKLLLEAKPDLYAYHEEKEQEFRRFIKKDVSILRDRTGGKVRPMTMKEFREKIQAGQQYDLFDGGACSCFAPPPGEE